MIFPKTILIIRKDVKFIQEIDQTIINNPFQNLRKSPQNRNWSIIRQKYALTPFSVNSFNQLPLNNYSVFFPINLIYNDIKNTEMLAVSWGIFV